MLVNISYSIDLEDVPAEVRRFLERDILKSVEVDILHATQDTVAALKIDEENIGLAIQRIDKLRQMLVKADMRLNDCSNILKGYQKERLLPKDSQEEHQAPPEIEGVQQELADLRKQLTGEGNGTTSR